MIRSLVSDAARLKPSTQSGPIKRSLASFARDWNASIEAEINGVHELDSLELIDYKSKALEWRKTINKIGFADPDKSGKPLWLSLAVAIGAAVGGYFLVKAWLGPSRGRESEQE